MNELFLSASKKLHFLDERSHQLSRKQPAPTSEASKTGSSSRLSKDGPLKKSIKKSKAPSPSHPSQNHYKQDDVISWPISDDLIIRTIDPLMHESDIRTAIIICDGIEFFTQLNQNSNPGSSDALLEMTTMGKGWKAMGGKNPNICIFIFPDTSPAILSESFRSPVWAFFRGLMFEDNGRPTKQMIPIGPPDAQEVENLLNWHRIHRGLPVSWESWNTAVQKITRNLRSKANQTGSGLDSLDRQLSKLKALNTVALNRLSGSSKQEPAFTRLSQMQGLEVVSKWVQSLIDHKLDEESETVSVYTSSLTVARLRPHSSKEKGVSLHLALKGNPGTGKTTAAELLGEIFRDHGLLELGHTVKVTSKDFSDGEIARKTSDKITEALGGVLFIDEAYALNSSRYGEEAITTILEAMESHDGQFSVVIAGYPDQIDSLIDSNQGFASRFGEHNTLHISDYEPPILQHIFEEELQKKSRILAPELLEGLPLFFKNIFDKKNSQFGNARDIIKLVQATERNRANRVRRNNLKDSDRTDNPG